MYLTFASHSGSSVQVAVLLLARTSSMHRSQPAATLAVRSSATPRKMPEITMAPRAEESRAQAVTSWFFHLQHGVQGQIALEIGIVGVV